MIVDAREAAHAAARLYVGTTASPLHIADVVLAAVEPLIRANERAKVLDEPPFGPEAWQPDMGSVAWAADQIEADADAAMGHANPRDYEIVAWLREKADVPQQCGHSSAADCCPDVNHPAPIDTTPAAPGPLTRREET